MNSLNKTKSAYPQHNYGAGFCDPSPAYGGDCALDAPEGVSSSTKRLRDMVQQLNSDTWALRDFFGMSVPECENGSAPRPSGHKYDIDEMVISAQASLENVQLILNHLRS